MKTFTQDAGADIAESGVAMIRKPNIVFMSCQPRPFVVDTGHGLLRGEAGDYVAFDPILGKVWSITSEDAVAGFELIDDIISSCDQCRDA